MKKGDLVKITAKGIEFVESDAGFRLKPDTLGIIVEARTSQEFFKIMWHGMTSRKNCWMKRDEFTRISE
jgi:hypothetical protein